MYHSVDVARYGMWIDPCVMVWVASDGGRAIVSRFGHGGRGVWGEFRHGLARGAGEGGFFGLYS